jgi:hypothetical protein
MQYLSLIYFVKQPLHVSGMFIGLHQEIFTVYAQQLVRVIVNYLLAESAASQLKRVTQLLYIYSV